MKKLVLVVALAVVANMAWATPGGVDSKGCHNSDKIGYHCHPTRVRDVRLPNERLSPKKEAAISLREQCKRSPDDSVCRDRKLPKK